MADRHGSKTNKTRMFVCRGRNSFRFASFDPARVSTRGLPRVCLGAISVVAPEGRVHIPDVISASTLLVGDHIRQQLTQPSREDGRTPPASPLSRFYRMTPG